MENEKIREIFDKIALPVNNDFLIELKWRQANRVWLKKSQAIAIKILGTLKTQGKSQKDLAEKMGVSSQMINKILKGSQNLTLETISKIEIALNIHLIETSETLKEKLGQYEEMVHGLSETLKSIVNVFVQNQGVIEKQIKNYQTNNASDEMKTKTSLNKLSNLIETEPVYAMAV